MPSKKKASSAKKKKGSSPQAKKPSPKPEVFSKELQNMKVPRPQLLARRLKPTPEDIFYAALAYLWILFLIPMFKNKKDEFLHFHTHQGFVLFVTSTVLFILSLVPAIAFSVAPFLWVFFFAGWLVAFLHALAGRVWKIPLLGNLAMKLRL